MSEGGPLPRPWLLRALRLEQDREHGAAHLSREAVQAFREATEEAWTPGADPAVVHARLLTYSERLRKAQPSMAPVANRLARCVAALERGPEGVATEAEAIFAEIDRQSEALLAAGKDLFRPGARLLTHSFSDTVLGLIQRYGDRLERITVCEARPLNEGVRLAAGVAELALPVRVITEAQLELFVPECDVALVGADRVLPDGGVVNKAGTAVLARVCAAHGVPLYVAADTSKWVSGKHELASFHRERRSPTEVLPQPPAGVEVMNVAFDLTPAALVQAYLTEEGLRPSSKTTTE